MQLSCLKCRDDLSQSDSTEGHIEGSQNSSLFIKFLRESVFGENWLINSTSPVLNSSSSSNSIRTVTFNFCVSEALRVIFIPDSYSLEYLLLQCQNLEILTQSERISRLSFI